VAVPALPVVEVVGLTLPGGEPDGVTAQVTAAFSIGTPCRSVTVAVAVVEPPGMRVEDPSATLTAPGMPVRTVNLRYRGFPTTADELARIDLLEGLAGRHHLHVRES
jgi:hypothetical protein